MKITQLHFQLAPKPSKTTRPKTSSSKIPISPSILNSSQVISYFKSHQSNKRLKYYSTRNRDPNDTIDDKNIQILKEEFKKFQDRSVTTVQGSQKNSNKEVFNLIVKKYYKKKKLSHDFIDKKVKKQQNSKNVEPNKIETENQIAEKRVKDEIETINPQQITTEQHAPKYPSQILHCLQISTDSQKFFKQDSRGYSFLVTPKTGRRTVQVPEERLRRHRFNKSSVKQISQMTAFQNVDNFIRNSSQKKIDALNDRTLKSSRSQRNNTKAKRFIKIKNSDHLQNEELENINPYTQRQYLHVQLKSQNEKLKTIEKFLNSSIIESNMTKSFLVKTIIPQVPHGVSERVEKKYVAMKEGFYRKVRSNSVIAETKMKDKKKSHIRTKNDDLNGWEISQKIHEDHYVQIA